MIYLLFLAVFLIGVANGLLISKKGVTININRTDEDKTHVEKVDVAQIMSLNDFLNVPEKVENADINDPRDLKSTPEERKQEQETLLGTITNLLSGEGIEDSI